MIRRLILFLVLGGLLIGCASATILNVGPGQTYDTDGTSDQVQIQQAINAAANGDTIQLHSGTYSISAPISINSKVNITIRGNGTHGTVLQQYSYQSLLGSGHTSMLQIGGTTNSEFYGFEIRGVSPQVQPENYDADPTNDASENGMILYSGSNNNLIHDLTFTLLSGDAIYSEASNNNQVFNCVFTTPAHDCAQLWSIDGWQIYNNSISAKGDTGIRFCNAANSRAYQNTFDCPEGGHANGGVYFQYTLSNITVENNIFRDMYSGIIAAVYDRSDALYGGETGDSGTVNVSNNVFYNIFEDKYIYCPAYTVTQDANLYPATVTDWDYYTAYGYGYNNGSVSAPIAAFTANETDGTAPKTIQFSDAAVKYPVSWSWDLDGDGDEDSTEQNPVWTYDTDGSYDVSLTVTNAIGSDTETKTDYIKLTNTYVAPIILTTVAAALLFMRARRRW